jgi:hypothetical protein
VSVRKTYFAVLAVLLAAAVSTVSQAGQRLHEPHACVDETGHSAICTNDPTEWTECPAADDFGRCPTDPVCYDTNGPIQCTGKVRLATGRCVDGSVTASLTPEQACKAHGGVSMRYPSED